MSELKPGLSRTERVDTNRQRPMGVIDNGAQIYSTPPLLYDVEVVCRHLLLENIEPGKDSVGTRVELDLIAETFLGTPVDITATLTAVNGAAVSFDFVVRDDVEELARGKHNRFVVDVKKTEQRLNAKLAKVRG